MAPVTRTKLPEVLEKHESEILAEWVRNQLSQGSGRNSIDEQELHEQSRKFLDILTRATQNGDSFDDGAGGAWAEARDFLGQFSRTRAKQGYSPTETATFVFSLKQPLFTHLRRDLGGNSEVLADEICRITILLDKLGLYTTEVFQKGREEVITRQQSDLQELSTPVVELWEGILGLPIIGTLDSARTQVVMENLLQKIVETGASIAIIEITGVPMVDTMVAQHLLKTVAAARLMGADCIISGIRPQIAQTIVHLGLDLSEVTTKATLADAFAIALARTGLAIVKAPGAAGKVEEEPEKRWNASQS